MLILMVLFLVTSPLAQAQSSVDLEKEKAELLRLHQSDREAHFKTDVDVLQQRSPEEMISVSEGKVRRTSKTDRRKFFSDYFRGAKYYE